MTDYKIVISKPGTYMSNTLLYESDRQEAEKEAEKFRRGEFCKDLIKAGFIIEVKECDNARH